MLDMLIITEYKVLRNILSYYTYQIVHVQQLLPANLEARECFTLQFLARMEVDKNGHRTFCGLT